MPTKEEAEEIAERMASRLQQYNSNSGNPQRSSIPKLVLEFSVEAMKIHRLQLEERARESKANKAANKKTGRTRQRTGEEDSLRPERERGHSRRQHQDSPTQDRQLHDSQTTDRSAEPASESSIPTNSSLEDPESPPRERRKRKGRRSSPVGDPPKYKFKPDLTLGFGTHLRECMEYESRRIDKELRRKERRARRDERERRLAERGEVVESPPSSGGGTDNHESQQLASNRLIEGPENPAGSGQGTQGHAAHHSPSLSHGGERDIPPPVIPGGEYRPAQLYYSQRDDPQQTDNSVQRSASGNPGEESIRTPSNTPRGTPSVTSAQSIPYLRSGQESPRWGSYESFALAHTIKTESTATGGSDRTAREGDATPRPSHGSRPSEISPMDSAVAYERNSHADLVEQREREQAESSRSARPSRRSSASEISPMGSAVAYERNSHADLVEQREREQAESCRSAQGRGQSRRTSTHRGSSSGTTSRQTQGKHRKPPSKLSKQSKGPTKSSSSVIGYESNPQGDRVERMEREQAESAQRPPTQRNGQSGEASGRGVGRDGPSWNFDNIP